MLTLWRLTALTLFLSACGGSGSSENAAPSDADQNTAIEQPKLEPTPEPVPTPDPAKIFAIGDSLTNGAYSAQFRSRLSELTQLEVINHGVGGQKSNEIAARVGAINISISFEAPIFEPKMVEITDISDAPLTSQGQQHVDCADYNEFSCEIIRQNDKLYINFKTVSGPITSPLTVRMKSPELKENDIAIIWAGRNNASQLEKVLSDIASITEMVALTTPNIVIVSITNGGSEKKGSAPYNAITAINDQLSIDYAIEFINVRTILVDSYDPNSSDDTQDYSNDIVPRSLRADGVHLNQNGHDIVADSLFSHLKQAQFIADPALDAN